MTNIQLPLSGERKKFAMHQAGSVQPAAIISGMKIFPAKLGLIALAFLVCQNAMAQKRNVLEGDFKNLEAIAEFNVIFDYDSLTVDKSSEEEFLKDRMDKRDESKALEFRDGWFADRSNRYEPKFLESFNKRFKGHEMVAFQGKPESRYTLKIKTIWIHPGFNAGLVRSTSAVSMVVSVFETANPANHLLTAEYLKVPGKGAMGFDYNSGYRISEAYAKLGKEFADDIRKKARK